MRICLGNAEQKIKLASAKQDAARKHSAGSDKVMKKSLRQQTEVSRRALYFEIEVSSLKSQMSKVVKARDDATSLVVGQNQQARMLES